MSDYDDLWDDEYDDEHAAAIADTAERRRPLPPNPAYGLAPWRNR